MAKASNSKIIIGAIILIAIIAIGYFVLIGSQKELTFSNGTKQIDSILEKNNLSISELQNAIELPEKAKFSAAKNEISTFKSELSDYKQTSDISALKSLSDLYIGFFDSLIDTKEIEEKAIELGTNEATTQEEVCAMLPSIEEIISDSEAVLVKAKSLNSKIVVFEKNFPQFVEISKTEELKTNEEEVQAAIDLAKADLESQTEICTTTE